MTHEKTSSTIFGRLLALPFLVLVPAGQAYCQNSPPLAALMDVLRDRPDRIESGAALSFSCGQTQGDHEKVEAARSLAKLGALALPAVEGALAPYDSLGQPWEYIDSTGLLLSVYSDTKGAAAVPHLRAMLDNPHLAFMQSALDSSMAVALGITSYVSFRSWTVVPTGPPGFCGGQEPRDALNLLLLAWEANSRGLLETSLGPDALAALSSLLNGTTWDAFRARLWRDTPSAVAVGYRFDFPGMWSEARMKVNLEEQRLQGSAPEGLVSPQLSTVFKSSSGVDCGTRRVQFVSRSVGSLGLQTYVVNSADIEGLLHLVAACAAK